MNAIVVFALTCLSMLAMSNAQFQGFPMSGMSGGGGGGQLKPEQKECFQSFHDSNMGGCLQSLHTGMQTHSISPECCTYISKIHSSCASVIHHQNPFFDAMVQRHCSGGGSAGGRKAMPGMPKMPAMPGMPGAMSGPKMPGAAAGAGPKMPGAAAGAAAGGAKKPAGAAAGAAKPKGGLGGSGPEDEPAMGDR